MTEAASLIQSCKKRDPRAQRELYDRFKARLMGVCRRYTSRREEAQDVLQETFIRVFSKISQLDDPEKLESWLIRITINTAVSYYHRNKKYSLDDIALADSDSGDYELIISNFADEDLIRMINELPDGCRVVFNLFVVEGYSHAEIADVLGITESTSRSQLVYAKTLLKQKLNSVGVLRYERYA